MKYISKYEKFFDRLRKKFRDTPEDSFFVDNITKVKKTGQLGMLKKFVWKEGAYFEIEFNDGTSQVYSDEDIEKPTQEELDFYKSVTKYNL
jgi:hypothetical protein